MRLTAFRRSRTGLTARTARAYPSRMRTARWLAVVPFLLASVATAQVPSCTFGPGALPVDTCRPRAAREPDSDPARRRADAGEPLLRPLLRTAAPTERAAEGNDESRSVRRRPHQALPHPSLLRGGGPRPLVERHASRAQRRRHGRVHRGERGARGSARLSRDGLLHEARHRVLLQALQEVRDGRPLLLRRPLADPSRTATTCSPVRRSVRSGTTSRTSPARTTPIVRSST
jgi:hypothetical protein